MKTRIKRLAGARSLTATLGLAFLALSVVVLLVSGGLQIFFNLRFQQATLASQQQVLAQDAAKTVSSYIQERFSVLDTVVWLTSPGTVSQEDQRQVLAGLLGFQSAFRQLAVLNAHDQELALVSRLSQSTSGRLADQITSALLNQVRQGGKYIGPVYIDSVTMEPLVVMAVPATSALGDFQGTLVAEVNLKFMWDLVDQLEVGETGWAYVVNRQGNLIAFGDTSRVLRGENVQNLEKVSEFVSNPSPVDATPAKLTTGIRGTTVVGTYVPLGTPDWAVIIELPWQEAYQQVFRNILASVGITLTMAVLASLVGVFLARRLAVPLINLTGTATRIADGEMNLQAAAGGPREVASLATAFNNMTEQLRSFIAGLERRVAERTSELEVRSRYLQASAEVSQAASSILETDQLIRQTVELIRERFELYYVGLFLADELGEWAVLRAGTGEAGQRMLARGHRLQIGGGSMIGWSIANAKPRIAQVAEQDAVRLATAELPDTRSEAALPLRTRGKVIGALTVQSDRPGVFDEAALAVLQIMTDQVANAIENARLFADAQSALETSRRAYGELTREGWLAMLQANRELGFRFSRSAITPAEGEWQPEMLEAVKAGQSVISNDLAQPTLTVPLKVRDQVIGVLDLQRNTTGRPWTETDQVLLQTLTEQLGVALESARLYQDTQRRAMQEQLIGEVTGRIRESLDLDAVLQTAVQEIGEALALHDVTIQLEMETDR